MSGSRMTAIIVVTLCALAAVGCGDSDPVTQEVDEERSVVMTQLLRFNEQAQGIEEDLSGREAYRRYGEALLEVAEERGGRLLWSGSTGPLVIGESHAPFHEIVVVEHPSEEVYREVIRDQRVLDNQPYRQAGLECQWLIPAVPEDAIPNDALSGARGRTGAFLETAQADDPVPECPAPAALGVYPRPEGLRTLLRNPNDVPVVMVNLLRFKEWTEELGEGMTGAEAYGLYGEAVLPLVQSYGCRLIWTGRVETSIESAAIDDFHAVAFLEYPSDIVFLQVMLSREMAEIAGYRAAGLVGQWLIPGRHIQ
jgi:uncharacterized protein (DUF1330 family)